MTETMQAVVFHKCQGHWALERVRDQACEVRGGSPVAGDPGQHLWYRSARSR